MPKNDDAEVVQQSKIVPLSASALRPAMSAYLNAQGKMKEHQGELGDVIKNRVQPTGCSPKAFKLAAQLKRMSPEKCADFLRSFDQLVDMFGLRSDPDMMDIAEAKAKTEKKATGGNGGGGKKPAAAKKPVDVKSPKDLPATSGVPSGVKPATPADAAPPVH